MGYAERKIYQPGEPLLHGDNVPGSLRLMTGGEQALTDWWID
jgi:hypothetical protein